MKRSPKIVSRIPCRTQKAAQDTVAGCRELAAADLARASLMDPANGRRRTESSALRWRSRAKLIQRLDYRFCTRPYPVSADRGDGEPTPNGRNSAGVRTEQ